MLLFFNEVPARKVTSNGSFCVLDLPKLLINSRRIPPLSCLNLAGTSTSQTQISNTTQQLSRWRWLREEASNGVSSTQEGFDELQTMSRSRTDEGSLSFQSWNAEPHEPREARLGHRAWSEILDGGELVLSESIRIPTRQAELIVSSLRSLAEHDSRNSRSLPD